MVGVVGELAPQSFTNLEGFHATGGHGTRRVPPAANTNAMNNLVNIIILLLIVGWLIGFIGFGAMVGSMIHILLILAIVGIIFRLFSRGKSTL